MRSGNEECYWHVWGQSLLIPHSSFLLRSKKNIHGTYGLSNPIQAAHERATSSCARADASSALLTAGRCRGGRGRGRADERALNQLYNVDVSTTRCSRRHANSGQRCWSSWRKARRRTGYLQPGAGWQRRALPNVLFGGVVTGTPVLVPALALRVAGRVLKPRHSMAKHPAPQWDAAQDLGWSNQRCEGPSLTAFVHYP
jgi:hypothetical protein